MSAVHFESTYDDSRLDAGLRRSAQKIADWARQAAHSGETVEDTFGRIRNTIFALASLNFAKDMIRDIAMVRGEWQKYEAVLTNTLGSNIKAVDSLEMIADYGAKTNFQVNELTDSFVKLASQGFVPTRQEMESLGDLAASKAKSFDQLAEAIIDAETFEFERLKEFGIRASKDGDKVTFTFKGIKTEVDATSDSIRNYILSLGQLDGVKGSTEAISKTIIGLVSNFEDAVDRMFNSIGQQNEGVIAGAIKAGTELVNNYQEVIDILKVIVTAYGTYKGVLIAVSAIQKSALLAVQIKEYIAIGRALGFATANQIAFNRAAIANPYTLIAAGIATLVTALYTFNKETDSSTKAFTDFKGELRDATKEIDANFRKLNETKEGTEQRSKAIESINSKYGEYLTNLIDEKSSLEDIKKAQDEATAALAKNIAFKAQQSALEDTKETADNAASDFYQAIDKATSKFSEAQKGQIKALVEQYKEEVEKAFKETGVMSDTFSIDLYKIFNQTTGGSIGTQAAYNIKESIIDLIKSEIDLENSTKGLEEQYNSYLEALGLTTPQSEEATESLKTVEERIVETQNALKTAKKDLKEFMAPGSTKTDAEIKNQVDLVDELTKKLELLTGVKEKQEKEITDLKSQLDKLYKDLETADDKDRKIIAERIIELEKEKKLREELASQALKVAKNKTIKPKQVSADSIKGTITGQDGKPLFIGKGELKEIKKVELEFGKLNKRIKETKELNDDQMNNLLDTSNQILSVIDQITQKYAEQLGLNEEQAKVLNSGLQAMSGIADIASGNVIGGAAKLLDSAMSMFLKTPETLADKFGPVLDQTQKLISSINIASDALSNLYIDSSATRITVLERKLQDLAQTAKKLNDEFPDNYRYGPRRSSYGNIIEEKAKLEEEIAELSKMLLVSGLSDDDRTAIEAVVESYNSLIAELNSAIEEIIGVSIDGLGNSLADAFFQAEDAAQAFGDTVTDIIENVIKKQLTATYLTAPIEEAVKKLITDIDDGETIGRGPNAETINVGLTPEEAANFRDSIQAIYDTAQPAFQAMIDALGEQGFNFGDENVASGLAGQISQSITEDTASELVGLWNRTALDTRAIRDYTKDGIDHLVSIEANTYNTVLELRNAVTELRAINTNTKASGSRI